MSENKELEDSPSEEAFSQSENYDANKKGPPETYDVKDFCPGIRIEAKDFDGKWYPAKVSDVDWTENEILVHFENWNTKFDEWIPMDSSRLRPIQKQTYQQKDLVKFTKGEEVMAMWSPYQKYPATIQAVLANDRYDVLFYDGFLKRLKSHKISKLEGPVIKTEVKNFTDIGTKEERRERKRKINVAELFHINKRSKKKGLVHSKSQDIKTYPVSKSKSKSSLFKKVVAQKEIKDKILGSEANEVKKTEVHTHGTTFPTKALIDTIPAAFEVKYINGQSEMWSKQLYQRSEGRTAGKLDIVILNPQGRKFRSRNEIMKYCEENGIIYSHEAFDFSAKGRPKSKPNTQTQLAKIESVTDDKDKSLKKGQRKSQFEVTSTPPVRGTTNQEELLPTDTSVTENKVFIGEFEVAIENGKFICPVKSCSKHFRRENLLHMHVKHYHPEFSKYLDYTPSVTDLAYARTVGGLDGSEVTSPAPRKIAGAEKTDKTTIKGENLRRMVDFGAENSKESKKPKLDIRSESKSLSAKVLNDTLIPTSVQNEDLFEGGQKSKSHSNNLSSAKNVSSFNERDTYIQDSKNYFLENKSIEQIGTENENQMSSHHVIKTLRHPHRLHSRKKSSRFQGSFDEHMKKKKLIQIEGTKSQNKLGRHQQQSHLRHHLQQGKSPQTPISSQSCVEDSNSNTSSQVQNLARYPKPHSNLPNEISEQGEGTEDSKSSLVVENDKIEKLRRNEIINCVCGIIEEDGLMIQCDICLCWQHGHCAGILRELDVPDKYICAICKNPYRGRESMKYLHDQEWLKEGTLPSLSFRSKREDIVNQRKTILKRSHDLSGSIALLARLIHSLRVKVNIAEKKDHPKLWLWAKKWTEKKPNRLKEETEVKEEKTEETISTVKKEESLTEDDKQIPKAPEPEAPIDSAECRLNLLDHLIHYQTLIDARLSCIESLVAELESMQDDAVNDETPDRYPRTKATVQMLLRDLNTMKKIAII